MRIIRGKYGRRRFEVPHNITARPTTDFARENIFNVIENLVDIEGARVLDLFAGTGAVSFEFLSRGAAVVTSVEKAATQYNFIKKVAGQLGAENMEVVRGDVFKFLSRAEEAYDIVFADPPYSMAGFGEIPALVMGSKVVKRGGVFIVEHSSVYDFSGLKGVIDKRVYGSVNFTVFRVE